MRTAFHVDGKRAVGAVRTVVQEQRTVAVFGKRAFVEKLAPVDPEAIDAIVVLRRVRAVETVFLIMTPEGEVTILVGERIVAVLAVLRLRIHDAETRRAIGQRLPLVEEWSTFLVRLSRVQRIPSIGEKTGMTVHGKRRVFGVHGNNVLLAQIAGPAVQASFVPMDASQE